MNLPHHRSHPKTSSHVELFSILTQSCKVFQDLIFTHLEEFKTVFLKDENVWDIVDIRFSSIGISFVWVDWGGQHKVTDGTEDEFKSFLVLCDIGDGSE